MSFVGEQMIVASREDELQKAAYTLHNVAIKYNVKISVNKTKAITMKGKMNVRTKRVINNSIMEQVNRFNYFGYTITVSNSRYLEIKVNRFNQMCSIIRRILSKKTRTKTQISFIELWLYPHLFPQWLFQPIQGPGLLFSSVINFHRR
jgi:hypothetical protein